MKRLFFGLELPDPIRDQISWMQGGLERARFTAPENLHLTLLFLGECDAPTTRALEDELGQLQVEPFSLQLKSVGVFPPRGVPRSVHLGLEDSAALLELHKRLRRLARRAGAAVDRRKFIPHVTLARLKKTPERQVGAFLARHGLYRSDPFEVERICLYSSILSPKGSRYTIEAAVKTRPK